MIRVRFEPRDLWVGAYVDTERLRAFVCLLPCLPIVVDLAGLRVLREALAALDDYVESTAGELWG